MAYVAFKGGKKAIEEAEKLVTYYRYKGGSTPIDVKQILDQVVPHILNEGEAITVGKVMVTEVDIISEIMTNNEDKNKNKKPKFTAGYGLCFGQNQVKAIAMATLDRAMASENPKAPAEDEEFVLYHIDSIEASGFTSHFKLPHYVDFQAVLNRIRPVREQEEQEDRK